MTTHYTSSKGEPRLIAGMHLPHLENALAKLEREEPHRIAEIGAMRAEIAKREEADQ